MLVRPTFVTPVINLITQRSSFEKSFKLSSKRVKVFEFFCSLGLQSVYTVLKEV